MSSPVKPTSETSPQIWLSELIALTLLAREEGKEVFSSVELITPERAAYLLTRNPNNKSLSKRTVQKYADAMRKGEWEFNGEAIILSDGGLLNDGQHRNAAVVECGIPIKMLVILGVARSTMKTLNTGTSRKIADQLTILGYDRARDLGTAGLYAYQLNTLGYLSLFLHKKPTPAALREWIVEMHEKDVGRDIVPHLAACPVSASKEVGSAALHAALRWWMSTTVPTERIDEFLERLRTGANLESGSPILVARTRLMTTLAMPINDRALLLIRAWNAWRRGKTLSNLQLRGATMVKGQSLTDEQLRLPAFVTD